jgi:hypothetical protein
MLDFLWHLRGSVSLPEPTTDHAVLDAIERLLDQQQKPSLRTSTEIRFNAPLWENLLGPNWAAMMIHDRGRFRIETVGERRLLRYDLRSLHGFIFCLLGSGMFFTVGGWKHAVFAFSWIYGMNIVLALIRVPISIRKAVKSA